MVIIGCFTNALHCMPAKLRSVTVNRDRISKLLTDVSQVPTPHHHLASSDLNENYITGWRCSYWTCQVMGPIILLAFNAKFVTSGLGLTYCENYRNIGVKFPSWSSMFIIPSCSSSNFRVTCNPLMTVSRFLWSDSECEIGSCLDTASNRSTNHKAFCIFNLKFLLFLWTHYRIYHLI